ncbi:MAG: sulfatase-like hydrolase/transferase [Lachnospiraceae bacterium]|nr:sulfatase-like hydrolase/transferase [Lachnospiraceae bacterium]
MSSTRNKKTASGSSRNAGSSNHYNKKNLSGNGKNRRQQRPASGRLTAGMVIYRVLASLILLAIPFACFFALEYFTHDPWLMAGMSQLFNYLILLAAGLAIFALTGHSVCAVILLTVFCGLVGAANFFVMRFRGNPILPWDLRSLRTAMVVADNYEFSISERFVISITILAAALILGLIFRLHFEKKLFSFRNFSLKRLLLLICSVAAAGGLSKAMMTPAITDQVLTHVNLFSQWASYRDNGFVVTFLQNMQYMIIEKPAGYNKETLDKEVQDFINTYGGFDTASSARTDQSSAENRSLSTGHESAANPHIIVLMNETFSDLSVLHEFESTEDPMPYVHALQKKDAANLITGNLFVSVLGGNTANTEFEFLSGNTMAFLPPGSVVYQQYIDDKTDTIAWQLRDTGYDAAGLHPYGGNGWNRDKVYPLLGFDHSYFKERFPNPFILRKYISDDSAYARISELLGKHMGSGASSGSGFEAADPQFYFEVTMQNHGGYSEIYDNCPITVEVPSVTSSSKKALENYLTLMKYSDSAFEEMVSRYEDSDEPVMIITFGDHQPNDYVAENIASMTGTVKDKRSQAEQQNRYIVPYVVWANFDLDKEAGQFVSLPDDQVISDNPDARGNVTTNSLSVNYLGASIMALTGQELTNYQQFLMVLRHYLPVVSASGVIDAEGKHMTVEEAQKAYPEMMNLYQKLQYRAMFDKD